VSHAHNDAGLTRPSGIFLWLTDISFLFPEFDGVSSVREWKDERLVEQSSREQPSGIPVTTRHATFRLMNSLQNSQLYTRHLTTTSVRDRRAPLVPGRHAPARQSRPAGK